MDRVERPPENRQPHRLVVGRAIVPAAGLPAGSLNQPERFTYVVRSIVTEVTFTSFNGLSCEFRGTVEIFFTTS